jgi:ADP-heptose:LPS heptosyltransferase
MGDHPFSASMRRTAADLRHAGYDVCVVLDRAADQSLLWLAGQTGARVRAGFDVDGAYPYVNFRMHLGTRPLYRPDQNLFMARMLGAAPKQNSRWGVSKIALEEAGRLLAEAHVAPDAPLVCFEGFSFCRRHGAEWTGAQMRRLGALGLRLCWLTAENTAPDEPAVALLRQERVPAFAGIPVAHVAALVRRARLVIAGKSSLFEMAHLLDAQAIGVFDAGEAVSYCPASARIRCVCYNGAPDQATIEAVAAAAGSLAAVGSRY